MAKSKWNKWKAGAAGALGLALLFHEVKASTAFMQAHQDALKDAGAGATAEAGATKEYTFVPPSSQSDMRPGTEQTDPQFGQDEQMQQSPGYGRQGRQRFRSQNGESGSSGSGASSGAIQQSPRSQTKTGRS